MAEEQLTSPHQHYDLFAIDYTPMPTVKGWRWLGENCPCGYHGVYCLRQETEHGSQLVRYCSDCGLTYYYLYNKAKDYHI